MNKHVAFVLKPHHTAKELVANQLDAYTAWRVNGCKDECVRLAWQVAVNAVNVHQQPCLVNRENLKAALDAYNKHDADTPAAIGSKVIFTPHNDDEGHGNLKYAGQKLDVIGHHEGLAILSNGGEFSAFTIICNPAWYKSVSTLDWPTYTPTATTTVNALRIKEVRGTTLIPEDDRYDNIEVSPQFVSEQHPQAGGFYTVDPYNTEEYLNNNQFLTRYDAVACELNAN